MPSRAAQTGGQLQARKKATKQPTPAVAPALSVSGGAPGSSGDDESEAVQQAENDQERKLREAVEKLSDVQKGELRACFDAFDEDGSGCLCARARPASPRLTRRARMAGRAACGRKGGSGTRAARRPEPRASHGVRSRLYST